MDKKHTNRQYFIYISLISAVLAFPIYAFIGYFSDFDTSFQSIFKTTGTVRSYSMKTETTVSYPGKTLRIDGKYFIDSPTRNYASHTRTSLILPNKEQTFMLDNVSLKNDVYVRITTGDAELRKTFPNHGKWLRFDALKIPSQYANIAVPGPVLDNLLLLSEDGKFLSFVKNLGAEHFNGTTTTRYHFKLSGATPEGVAGPLHALLSRIGGNGTVDVWSHPDGTVEGLYFSNDTYRSTTTITSLSVPKITPPQMSQ